MERHAARLLYGRAWSKAQGDAATPPNAETSKRGGSSRALTHRARDFTTSNGLPGVQVSTGNSRQRRIRVFTCLKILMAARPVMAGNQVRLRCPSTDKCGIVTSPNSGLLGHG